MKSVNRLLAAGVAGLIMMSVAPVAAGRDDAATAAAQETAQSVRKALARLPDDGVFDFLAFHVDGGTVTLKGFAHRPALKREAEDVVRRAVGADVVNQIEILPSSSFDDRIRWDAFQRVYTDDIASRYVAGGHMKVRYELLDMALFSGMEPYGTYPVHIIVKGRRLLLIGALDNDLDKNQVLIHARQTPNTQGLEDAVMVRPH